jgi:UDP-N-acetylmuramate dehydrogenase
MMAAAAHRLRGELRFGEPLARHTSWRVGGPADQFYRPADLDDLADFLMGLPEGEALLWLGLGSNLLVRDGGFRGVVIALAGVLDALERLPGNRVRAGAGVSCAKVARFCVDQGLTGSEFLAGIPGLMGGALAMNAGAWGGDTWGRVASVESIDRRGMRHARDASEYRVGYRSVQAPAEEWFTAAVLELDSGDPAGGRARIRELLAERARTQPMGLPSCGSVFRNPEGGHAGQLIESAGLKGFAIGGARVSEKHANFIINTGDATAADIEALIRHIQDTVRRIHGVSLEPEVRVVGEPGASSHV